MKEIQPMRTLQQWASGIIAAFICRKHVKKHTSIVSSSPSLFLFSLNSGAKQFVILRTSGPGEDSSVQEFCPGACNEPITNPGEFSFPSPGPKTF